MGYQCDLRKEYLGIEFTKIDDTWRDHTLMVLSNEELKRKSPTKLKQSYYLSKVHNVYNKMVN